MESIIGLKELRENMETYEKRVKRGHSFIVMKRSKPIFRLTPVDEEIGWETVVDFTKLRKGGIPANELINKLKRLKQ